MIIEWYNWIKKYYIICYKTETGAYIPQTLFMKD